MVLPELVTYHGSCHCKAVTYTMRLPSLSTDEVGSCDCSVCTRNGYLMCFPDPKDVSFTSGVDNIAEYRFASQVGVHKFCRTCGSSICAAMKLGQMDMIAMNARLLQDVDLDKLKLELRDGKKYPPLYEYPHFPDTKPEHAADDTAAPLVPYHGNCQCRAVTFTARIPSLSEYEINNCNCSICVSNGYLLAYPEPKDVVFHTGHEELTGYKFGKKVMEHKFCRKCGSSVYIDEEAIGDTYAMNVRMFKDIDLKTLKYEYSDGRSD